MGEYDLRKLIFAHSLVLQPSVQYNFTLYTGQSQLQNPILKYGVPQGLNVHARSINCSVQNTFLQYSKKQIRSNLQEYFTFCTKICSL